MDILFQEVAFWAIPLIISVFVILFIINFIRKIIKKDKVAIVVYCAILTVIIALFNTTLDVVIFLDIVGSRLEAIMNTPTATGGSPVEAEKETRESSQMSEAVISQVPTIPAGTTVEEVSPAIPTIGDVVQTMSQYGEIENWISQEAIDEFERGQQYAGPSQNTIIRRSPLGFGYYRTSEFQDISELFFPDSDPMNGYSSEAKYLEITKAIGTGVVENVISAPAMNTPEIGEYINGRYRAGGEYWFNRQDYLDSLEFR